MSGPRGARIVRRRQVVSADARPLPGQSEEWRLSADGPNVSATGRDGPGGGRQSGMEPPYAGGHISNAGRRNIRTQARLGRPRRRNPHTAFRE